MAIPQEKYTVLEMEIAKVVGILLEALAEDAGSGTEAIAYGLERYAQQVEHIGIAAGTAGLSGLQDVCTLFRENLHELGAQNRKLTDNERELLEEWPTLVMGYLESPADRQTYEALVEHLCNSTWSTPLSADEATVMCQLLAPADKTFADSMAANSETEVPDDSLLGIDSIPTATDSTTDTPPTPAESAQANPDIETFSPDTEASLTTTEKSENLAVSIQTDDTSAEPPLPSAVQDMGTGTTPASPATSDVALIPATATSVDNTVETHQTPPAAEQLADAAHTAIEEEPAAFSPAEYAIKTAERPQTVADSEAIAIGIDPSSDTTDEAGGLAAAASTAILSDKASAFLEQKTISASETAITTDSIPASTDTPTSDTEPDSTETAAPADSPATEPAMLLTETSASDSTTPASLSKTPPETFASTPATTQESAEQVELPTSPVGADRPIAEQSVTTDTGTIAPAKLTEAQREVVETLCAEIGQIAEVTAETLTAAEQADAAQRTELLTSYAEDVERLTTAVEAIGLTGLHHVCAHIHLNLLTFANQAGSITPAQRQVLESWPEQVLNYLQAWQDRTVSKALVQCLQADAWPASLAAETAPALLDLLLTPTLDLGEAELEARPHQALPEDVSLALPEDANPELLDSLLQELPSQTADFSAAMQRFIEGAGTLADVDAAQRIAHTLKGAANTVGVRGIANLTHQTEDILLALSKHTTLPNRALAQTLIKVSDCLETMSESLVGMSPAPADAQSVLQEVLDWANRIDREGIPTDDEAPPPAATPSVPTAGTVAQPATTTAVPAATETATAEAVVPMLRVPAPFVNDLLRLVGETMILTGQIHEQVRQTLRQAQSLREQNFLFQQLTIDLERLVDIQNIMSPLERSMPDHGFDPLEFEQYNELHTVSRRLIETATDSQELGQNLGERLKTLDTLLITQERLHRDNQEAVLRTRMIPVKSIIPRLQRSVRQTCRLTDKQAELYINGADTLIDSNVLNDITDPLMHLLRNAIDHGIEHSEARQTLGKVPSGRIELSFMRDGNNIAVRCQDDGAGLNMDKIRQVAENHGLIEAGRAVTDDELIRLILMPGFSTRGEVTQTSGRGIGLDAVQNKVLELKGSLNLHSEAGKGCLFELRLPVTLLAAHALLVRSRQQRYAIAERGLVQILYPESGRFSQLGGAATYQIGDDIYALTEFETLLNLPSDRRGGDRSQRPVLLIQDETREMHAVLVEEILDSRDMVIKSLGDYLPKLRGIVGATILGDGSVVPVLDLPELLRTPVQAQAPVLQRESAATTTLGGPERRTALVVDDSLSARRSLAQFMRDAGFDVRTARDGLEAISIIDGRRPDILLVDLEMPRMNGLELTSHVRSNAVTQDLPVIVVTSRSTTKHRQQAETVGVNAYITKPFAEEELLEYIQSTLGAA